jgi:hypothetical protein
MSTPIREIFLALGIKTDAAVDGLDKVDDAIDDSKKNLKGLEDQSKQTSAALKDFGSKIADGAKVVATAIAAATTATALFFESWSKGAAEVDRTSKTYGIGTDALQELRFAAEKLGGNGEAITEVFKEMSLRITEFAETGSGPAGDALTLLKLRAEDLKKLKPEDQFSLLADSISKVADEGTKVFLKDSLFGEAGLQIGPLMDKGADGIANLRKEAQSLGVVLDKDAIKQANELRQSFFTLHKTGEGFVNFLATRMSGKIKEIVDRLVSWATANKDVIATRIEKIMMQMVELLEKVGPLLGQTVDMFSKLVDQVGGLDRALYGAGAAWAAWQLAAMSAINPVTQAIGALTAGFAVGASLMGYAKKFEVDTKNLRQEETSKFNAAARLLETPSTGVAEDDARAFLEQSLLNFGLLTQLDKGKIRSDEMQRSIDEQLAEIDKASAMVSAFDELRGRLVQGPAEPSQGGASFELGKIVKPGAKTGEKPITSASEIAAAEKRARELDRDRRIRTELETMRATSEGPRRMAIETALRNVEQRINGGHVKDINELIAEAVGQGTGLGSGALKPAGLGTTINNIDASVFFNLGGIEVTAEVAGAVSSQAQAAGKSIGEAVMDVLQPWMNSAFQAQRGQILG